MTATECIGSNVVNKVFFRIENFKIGFVCELNTDGI